MREVVIVSSWRRPQYLNQCLAALLRARGSMDKEVWVFQNDRPDANLSQVHERLSYYHECFPHYAIFPHTAHSWMDSQRFAWEVAHESGAARFYFLSDDVVVTPDFFEWHEAVNAAGEWSGSTAWRHPQGQTKEHDPAAYYQIEFPNEISMGLSVPHWAAAKMVTGWPTQDELKENNWKIVMPYAQRCFHIGGLSSESVNENFGPAIDILPNPIPDYGRQNVVLRP